MENKTVVSGGISFTGMLTIVFIVLKLCKVISWSWWWVLVPLWAPVALFVVGYIFVFVCALIAVLFDKK